MPVMSLSGSEPATLHCTNCSADGLAATPVYSVPQTPVLKKFAHHSWSFWRSRWFVTRRVASESSVQSSSALARVWSSMSTWTA
jgi:hypothetical protein